MNYVDLRAKLDSLPEHLKQEVADFIDFLKTKNQGDRSRPTPVFGSAKGKIKMAADFDAPLDDFKEYM